MDQDRFLLKMLCEYGLSPEEMSALRRVMDARYYIELRDSKYSYAYARFCREVERPLVSVRRKRLYGEIILLLTPLDNRCIARLTQPGIDAIADVIERESVPTVNLRRDWPGYMVGSQRVQAKRIPLARAEGVAAEICQIASKNVRFSPY